MAFKPGNPGGGRPKGLKNKATRDIRELIQRTVDFEALTKELYDLAFTKKEKWAFDMLYQYGFGKPVEIQIAPMNVNVKSEEGQSVKHEHALDVKSISALTELANKLSKRSS